MTYNRDSFYHALLDELGAPANENNMTALRAWGECEGSAAEYNPLDTTWPEDGATPYNTFESDGATMHVWNYPSESVGVRATASTLRTDYYTHILAALYDGSGKIVSGDARSDMRVWGTNPDCIAKKLEGKLTDNTKPKEPTLPKRALAPNQRDTITRAHRILLHHQAALTDADKAHVKELIKVAQRVVKR